eukprot:c15617_g2_i1 orf=3-845(-)
MSASFLLAAQSATVLTHNSSKKPRGMDSTHKSSNEYLALECSHNTDMLYETETQYSCSSACSSSSSRNGRHIRETMSQAQDQDIEGSKIRYGSECGWEMLSIEEALACLEGGPLYETLPSVSNLASILSKCRKDKNRSHVLRLHAYLRERGMEAHSSLGNELVSALVDTGNIHDAQKVFDKLVYRNERSWNSLISGYGKGGEPQIALTLYQKWQEDNTVCPKMSTLVALIKACTKLKDLEKGSRLHAEIVRTGLLESDLFVGSSLVYMYTKCGCLAKAQEV